jgi:hypothetical protein
MNAKALGWDYSDPELNGTTPRINRQKSARHIEIQEIDREAKRGITLDPDGVTHVTSTQACDCVDFMRQKTTFQPCKHMYRLAAELGLLELAHKDRKEADKEQRAVDREFRKRFPPGKSDRQIREEWLRQLRTNLPDWDSWDPCIHDDLDQIKRASSAAELVKSGIPITKSAFAGFRVGDYYTSYTNCDCPDFRSRGLPCKHMYAIRMVYSYQQNQSK